MKSRLQRVFRSSSASFRGAGAEVELHGLLGWAGLVQSEHVPEEFHSRFGDVFSDVACVGFAVEFCVADSFRPSDSDDGPELFAVESC